MAEKHEPVSLVHLDDGRYQVECPCGWKSEPCCTHDKTARFLDYVMHAYNHMKAERDAEKRRADRNYEVMASTANALHRERGVFGRPARSAR